jgi:heptosyltransferase II
MALLQRDPHHASQNQCSESPCKIIVLAREHIGDLVCTTPALRSLRLLCPRSRITVEVGERAACVLDNNPNIDEIILRPSRQGILGKLRFVHLLRRRRFDLGIILDSAPDMRLYLWLGGVRRRVGLVQRPRFAHLLTDAIALDPTLHQMIDNFAGVISHLGGDASNRTPEVFPAAEDVAHVDRLFAGAGVTAGVGLVGLNLGASTAPKMWPAKAFAELGDLLARSHNVRSVLLGGPADAPRALAVAAGMSAAPVDFTGVTVMQQAEIQRRCSVLVTADTGPMHLACATGTPVVALFGPTSPEVYGPWYVPGNVIIRKTTGCEQCSWLECAHVNRCMMAIAPKEVCDAVIDVLRRAEGSSAGKASVFAGA